MKNLILLLVLLTTLSANAQLEVATKIVMGTPWNRITKEDFVRLKKTKTVFVYRANDDKEAMEKAIREVWDITEISFVPYEEMHKYKDGKTSILSIVYDKVQVGRMNEYKDLSNNRSIVIASLSLWIPEKKRKKYIRKKNFLRLELQLTAESVEELKYGIDKSNEKYLYEKAILPNWKIGFLKNYLRIANDLLKTQTSRNFKYQEYKNPKLKLLRKQVLYVPEYVLYKYGTVFGASDNRERGEELFKKYPYKIKIVKDEVLNQMILEAEETFCYMLTVASSNGKTIAVFSNDSGEIIYGRNSLFSNKLKSSDFKELAKAVKKAK